MCQVSTGRRLDASVRPESSRHVSIAFLRRGSPLALGLLPLFLLGCDAVLGLGDYKFGCPDGTVVDSADAACPTGATGSSSSGSSASGTTGPGSSSSSTGSGGAGGSAPDCEAMGLTTCGTECADLQKDGDHCNACDHSCGGGECLDGICQPQTLATGIADLHAIAINSTRLYFSAGDLVRQCVKGGPCSGAGLQTLADFTGDPDGGTGSLAVTENLIVFLGDTNGTPRVYACPASGCATLAALGSSLTGYTRDLPIVESGNTTVAYLFNIGGLGVVSTTCMGAQCANLAARQNKSVSAAPLAATSTHYYYQRKLNGVVTGIVRCPTTEGSCATVTDVSSITAGVSKLVTTPSELFFLWAGGPSGGSAIGRCPLAGCPSGGAPTMVRSSISMFPDMTVEGADAFWIDAGTIRACPYASCAAPHDLATGAVNASNLIADGKFVYWIENANTQNGAIRRVAR